MENTFVNFSFNGTFDFNLDSINDSSANPTTTNEIDGVTNVAVVFLWIIGGIIFFVCYAFHGLA